MSRRERKPDKRQLPPGLHSGKEFEQWVFLNAAEFKVLRFVPRENVHSGPPRWEELAKFNNPSEAVRFATQAKATGLRSILVSAITASGRHFTMGEQDWAQWLEIWNREH